MLCFAGSAEATFRGFDGKIAISSARTNVQDGYYRIWLMETSGRGGELTFAPTTFTGTVPTRYVNDSYPSFAASGKLVVFSRTITTCDVSHNGYVFSCIHNLTSLYTIKANGRRLREVLNTRNVSATKPSFSPDGKWIAFEGVPPRSSETQIYRIRLDGTHLKQLTHGQYCSICGPSSENPSVSATGKQIAFDRDGYVWVMRPDGKHLRRLAGGLSPSFSPDAKRIVFVAFRSDGSETIMVMNANGTHQRELYHSNNGGEPPYLDRPDFSPNGRSIVFEQRYVFTPSGGELWQIYVMESSGRFPQPITGKYSCPSDFAVCNRQDNIEPNWGPEPR